MEKDKIESARVQRLVRAKPKQCFLNAVRVDLACAGISREPITWKA